MIRIGLRKSFWLKKIQILFHGYSIELNGEKFVGTFYEKELQKKNWTKFKIEKNFNRKDDKMFIKWKGYENSFNSWIDEKDIVI